VLLLAGLSVLAATAGVARADGDPASDVLFTDHVFFAFDTHVSGGAQEMLRTAVREANAAGYPIRVAVIEKPADLGAVTSLWARPGQYARFLDVELSYGFKGPLLVVMPSGLGFHHYQRSSDRENRVIRSIRVGQGADGVALAASTAVERLSAQAGHPIAPPPAPVAKTSSIFSKRLLVGGVVLVVAGVLVGGLLLMAARRRKRSG
jgi:uncharacterized protein GlcG (DUF336 family)